MTKKKDKKIIKGWAVVWTKEGAEVYGVKPFDIIPVWISPKLDYKSYVKTARKL